MIVPDTNVVAYLFIQGARTPLARQVWSVDPDWRLPDLWRHEYLNSLATHARHGAMEFEAARRLWLEATDFLSGCAHAVAMAVALQVALRYKISAYDAQFIALAQTLGVLCITEDLPLRRKFPRLTRSMQEFCAR